MSQIPVPFDKGQHEEVDAKLLPNGLFTQMTNVRYPKSARVAFRHAYIKDPDSSAPVPSNVVADLTVGPKETVAVTKRSSPTVQPFAIRRDSGGYGVIGTTNSPTAVGLELGVPQRVAQVVSYATAGPTSEIPLTQNFPCTDIVLDSGNKVSVVYHPQTNYGASLNVGASVWQCKSDSQTAQPFFSSVIDATATNIKVVTISGNLAIFWADSSNRIRMSYNGGAAVTVVTASAGRAPYFDVSQSVLASEVYLIYQSAANLLRFGEVDNTGTFFFANQLALVNTEGRASICSTFNSTLGSAEMGIAWIDGASFTTGNCRIAVYNRNTLTFTIAATTVTNVGEAAAGGTGYPVIGPHSTKNWTALFNVYDLVDGFSNDVMQVDSSLSSVLWPMHVIQSKPFIAGNGVYAITSGFQYDLNDPFSYMIIDATSNSGTKRIEAVFGFQLSPFPYVQDPLRDPRRKVVSVAALGAAPGLSALMVALPFQTTRNTGWMAYRLEYGDFADISQAALLNNQVTLSGGRILEYDRNSVFGAGFTNDPTINTVTASAGGSIDAGDHQYVAVWEYVDNKGYRHLSAPSLPSSTQTVVAPNQTRAIQITNSLDADKRGAIRLYRTQAGGTVFFEVAVQPFGSGSGGPIAMPQIQIGSTAITDNLSDAAIATNEVLYTQGARGGLSGLLQNDQPPGAKYIWAGSDRLLLGGMEVPEQVQWSKLRFDGEPIQWSNSPAFRARVDQAVTAVAEMDGIWIVFTKDAIWTVSGQGPDDTGAGSFDVPRRLPSDIGCISARSLRLAGEGLYFQGASDRIYLLPRGGGEPQWIGMAVRDTLASFPFVSASAFDQDSGYLYWAVCDATASTGRLLVLDTRTNEWSVDNFFNRAAKTLSIYNGLLVIDGAIIESTTSYNDSDGSSTAAVVPTVTTGDMRAFGMAGWGRYKKVQILGEVRDIAVAWTLTMDVSYDSGKTWTTEGQWTRANLGAAVGDAFDQADHMFWTQKSDTIRLRFSISTPSATEGFVLNGLTLEVFGAPGTKRNPNSLRAA